MFLVVSSKLVKHFTICFDQIARRECSNCRNHLFMVWLVSVRSVVELNLSHSHSPR